VNPDLARWDRLGAVRIKRHPTAVLFRVQIAHRVQGDRFQEHHHALLFARQPHAGPQHPHRIGTGGRTS
jgi:hypothetical protein